MESFSYISTLEILPDEILLEICKYLLCSDVLYSFYGLNYRMTRMISPYCYHLSLYKTNISTYDYLCTNVIPNIGSQVRSLVLDNEYSVLQDVLFIKYFGDKMSLVFPNLQKVTLISYVYDELMTFLDTLHDLHHLVEIYLCSYFETENVPQHTLIQSLMQANNHRFTTIIFDHFSSALHSVNTNRYLNILQLHITLKTISDFVSLCAAIPNIQHLDVIINETDDTYDDLSGMNLFSLQHLINFRLKSIMNLWTLDEFITLLNQLSTVRNLSLFLATSDQRLIKGDIILPLLPSTIQQFHYAITFSSDMTFDDVDNTDISSWLPSHPVTYISSNSFLFLHTIPWHFPSMICWSIIAKMICSQTDEAKGYTQQVEQLYLNLNKKLSLVKYLPILTQCRRLRELTIYDLDNDDDDNDVLEEKQPVISSLPKLSRLRQAYFAGAVPSDLNSFSLLMLNAAPNLFRLDLPFAHLWKLIESKHIGDILGQRITSISITENPYDCSLPELNEEHIPIIASVLYRVRDLYVDLTHLFSSTMPNTNEDILHQSFLHKLFGESFEQNEDIILENSSESMLLCLLTNFRNHKLLELCVTGAFLPKIKTDSEEWLQNNSILCQQQFKSSFINNSNRLLIWM